MKSLLRTIHRLGGRPRDILGYIGLAVTAAFFESFGIAMLLPVLQFIEKGRDVESLAQSSDMWRTLIDVFAVIGLPVTLASLLGLTLTLIFTRIVLFYFRQVGGVRLTHGIAHRVRTSLFNASVKANYAEFGKDAVGTIISRATTETERLGVSVFGLTCLCANALVMLGYLVVLLWVSAKMTIFAGVSLGLAGGVALRAVRRTKKVSRSATDANKAFAAYVVERLGAVRLIKLSAAEEREMDAVESRSKEIRDFIINLSSLAPRIDLIMEPVVVLGGLIILYMAVSVFGLGLAEMGVFLFILLRLLPLSKEAMRSRQTFLSGVGSFETIQQALDHAESHMEPGGGERRFERLQQGVELQGVVFGYPGRDEPALKDINLAIPAGRVTALVGPSGAGKSTLADLLPRLHRPQKGRILFDGAPLEEYDLASLRRGVAYVSQDAAFFNDSVRNNVAYSRPEATDDELWEALRWAGADDFVRDLPDGLDTVLSEGGGGLSGGQRQRLSLARALLLDASLLILDEPTSALDSQSEEKVKAAVRKLRGGERCTVLIIAHRMSAIRDADLIVVLKDGRVVQQGTHDQLMNNPEWYAMINDLQQER